MQNSLSQCFVTIICVASLPMNYLEMRKKQTLALVEAKTECFVALKYVFWVVVFFRSG